MSHTNSDSSTPSSAPRRFATTHWSCVLSAGRKDRPDAHAALETLCRTYWYPLYAFVRRRGYSADDARDLIQEFFAELLEKDFLATADPQRGRFRTFLLTILQRFLAKQRDRAAALKRGGGRQHLSIDVDAGEERYQLEPFHELTAERIYERRWALTLLESVLDRLEQEYKEKRQSKLFERLRPFLTGGRSIASYANVSADLETTEGAVKVAVHRLRRRYRDLLQDEIAQTVETSEDVQQELDYLLAALRLE